MTLCHSRMEDYQPRTFRPGSINSQRRVGLLPAYPSARDRADKHAILLLSNVAQLDRERREKESFCGGHGIGTFELKQNRFMDPIDSFMIDLYRDLFVEPSQRWKIECSIIDYNLCRLRKCMTLYTAQTNEPALLSFDEWPIALEFYLQIDGKDSPSSSSFVRLHFLRFSMGLVDMFFMKTCQFRGAEPRSFDEKGEVPEGILCEAPPKARYAMVPCRDQHCFLCQSKTAVQFASNQSHRFVNQYEAILNCHAVSS
jgi:hypothetical protein